jgi:hypothetical protein
VSLNLTNLAVVSFAAIIPSLRSNLVSIAALP